MTGTAAKQEQSNQSNRSSAILLWFYYITSNINPTNLSKVIKVNKNKSCIKFHNCYDGVYQITVLQNGQKQHNHRREILETKIWNYSHYIVYIIICTTKAIVCSCKRWFLLRNYHFQWTTIHVFWMSVHWYACVCVSPDHSIRKKY